MAKQKPLTERDGDVRELEDADFSKAVPFSGLPASLRRKVGARGPQKEPTKERISIRLSRDVVESFRASGSGWQARMDAELTRIVRAFRARLATHLVERLEDRALDLKTKIEVIQGTLENAPYPPSVTVTELIEKAEAEAGNGHDLEAQRLLRAAIHAYRRGRFAA